MSARALRAFAAGALIWLGLAGVPAAQQLDFDRPQVNGGSVLITADELTQDEELGTVVARGNVEVAYGDRTLFANAISYNQTTDTVSASGDIVLMEPTGDVIFADYLELTDELKNGFVEGIKVLLEEDESRFAANQAVRQDGNRTIMRRGVYSPCTICEEDPEKPPLWQMKAEQIEHDQLAKEVRYKDVFLEMFGVPVLYSPYLAHPDPTVQRRTGLLAPVFGTSDDLGQFLQVPYFIVLDDSSDMTVAPIYTTEEGLVLAGEYRKRFNQGYFDFKGSLTEADRFDGDRNNSIQHRDEFRGHFDTEAEYEIDDTWRAGFDVERSTDRTYLRKFDFFEASNRSVLTSNGFVEGFRRKNYAALNIYDFQNLRSGEQPDDPLIAPTMDYNHVGNPDRFGGQLGLDVNFRNLYQDDAPDSQRISFHPSYSVRQTLPAGILAEVGGKLYGDLYVVDQDDPNRSDGITGRALPQAFAEFRLPLIRESGTIRQIIEPVFGAYAAPNGGNPDAIPNNDSGVFEMDETNLLRPDRFAGLDRVESGQRIAYGVKTGVYGRGIGQTTAFFGQSLRFHEDAELANELLIEDGLSDYVGRILVQPNEYVDLLYRFRLDQESFKPVRNEFSFTAGPSAAQVSGEYLFVSDSISTGGFPEREELTISLSSQISRYWHLGASTRRDLTGSGMSLQHAMRIQYSDECFTFRTQLARSFTRDADIEPSDTVLFQLIFKHLGEVTSSAG